MFRDNGVVPRQHTFRRGGFTVLKADSVYAAEICDVKKPSKSKYLCATCTVAGDSLADSDAHLHSKRRTSRGIEDALHDIKTSRGGSFRRARSKEFGAVVHGGGVHPFRPYALLDTVHQLRADRFHQDALARNHRDEVFCRHNPYYST